MDTRQIIEGKTLQRLSWLNAVIKDSHIVYTSGKHGSAYVNKDVIYTQPAVVFEICKDMSHQISGQLHELKIPEGNEIVVAAPAIGAVALSQWVGYYLGQLGWKTFAVYADKVEAPGKGFVFKRGYDSVIKDRRVVIVEDILTTGGSVSDTIKAAKLVGGDILMVMGIVNRGGITANMLGVSYFDALVNVTLDAYDEADCPLCKDGVPINTSVGHGAKFLARKQAEAEAQPAQVEA